MAVVTQEPFLFHASIKDNLCFGAQIIQKEELDWVVKLVNLSKEIENFSNGLETLIGERGITLSGGQKQRIAIGRAILSKRPILILDEATSALDSVTEKYIQDALLYLMKNRTTIVIAHRLSTLAAMDRILVFDKGHVIEDGNHKGYITSATLHTLSYFLTKEFGLKGAKEVLLTLLSTFSVIDAPKEVIKNALHANYNDIEDALQVYTALSFKMDFFLTSDKKLKKESSTMLPILTASEFVKEYINN